MQGFLISNNTSKSVLSDQDCAVFVVSVATSENPFSSAASSSRKRSNTIVTKRPTTTAKTKAMMRSNTTGMSIMIIYLLLTRNMSHSHATHDINLQFFLRILLKIVRQGVFRYNSFIALSDNFTKYFSKYMYFKYYLINIKSTKFFS